MPPPLRALADLIPPPTQIDEDGGYDSHEDDGVLNSCSEDEGDLEPLHEVINVAGPSRPVNRSASGLASKVGQRKALLFGISTPSRPGPSRMQATPQSNAQTAYEKTYYYSVQWRKPQTKKHKTWDGDAYLKIEGNRIIMLNEDSDKMGASTLVGDAPVAGCELRIGGYEVEVDSEISASEFKSRTTFLNRPQALPAAYAPSTFKAPFKPPTQRQEPRQTFSGNIIASGYTRSLVPGNSSNDPDAPLAGPSGVNKMKSLVANVRAGISESKFYAPKKAEKIVIGEKSNRQRTKEWGGALHDPNAEDAVVMQRPAFTDAERRKTDIVDVVLDPLLASKMREHQKDGVKFMYSCVMGLTGAKAQGCILADEMGLGKTLQTIALIYTLIKQSPFANETGVISKALIVCPVSLVDNWRKEFRKWLRPDQLNVVVANGEDHQVSAFMHHNRQHVLIIGYERLRKVINKLASCQPPIDLIICDEGHRLKSKDNKTTKMFDALRTKRRIILSGTPVQNDLSEYYSMVDFTCPGLLGKYAQFVKHYERPIMKSRSVGCSEKALDEGKERAEELGQLSREFVLRRTAAVLDNYLPPKYEYVVFIAPTTHQLKAFGRILNPEIMAQILRGESDKQPLGYIDLLRKISNTPTLLRVKRDDESSRSEHLVKMAKTALKDLPDDVRVSDVTVSGKLAALDRLLHIIYRKTQEKVVIVSNWTSTLNIIQEVCHQKKYSYLRLDGTTAQKSRQEYVESFNRSSRSESFVFLLSAKAGGVGLNLIGASRLILFDSDWNPSTDLQAMARIHRDGQKHPVYIYRFLTTNTIDEKIYQRQITKVGLADQMLDQGSTNQGSKDSFSSAELRDIFRLNLRTDGCQTHDLLSCRCTEGNHVEGPGSLSGSEEDGNASDDGKPKFISASQYDPEPTGKMKRKAAAEQQEKLAALKQWTHLDGFDKTSFNAIQDSMLYKMLYEDWTPAPTKMESSIESVDSKVASSEEDSAKGPESDNEEDTEIVQKPKKRIKNKVSPPAIFQGLEGVLDSASEDGDEEEEHNDVVMDSEEDEVGTDAGRTSRVESQPASARLAEFAYVPETSPSKMSSGSTGEEMAKGKQSLAEDGLSDAPRASARLTTGRKRDSDGKSKGQSKVAGTQTAEDDFGHGRRKHDLRDVAAQGQAGRIMFVFERISSSSM
ncbi:SNF2 family N-terminal domain-domain-containing protein [Kockovaella imperatae]|uniref:SNF2 family N-terminal domain-domain-containing protein n=1 Tax=Kockovaella imperatae TaxID=4999 RepID=A0A1Y1U8A4_9TREE|nr:SNF2 family N-terminal domain-domain-containing protein [Kockovaella imperatae]ORX34242.1 SNF2 family N-terminal domain-domain-containing protein [Kockovaella imperatae]